MCGCRSANLLGEENKGFSYLIRNLPQERLVIAVRAAMGMEVMLEQTVAYAKERQAFGQSVIDFQHNRFKLADAKAQAAMFRVFADHCLALHLRGELTVELAAAAKLLGAEMQNRCSTTSCRSMAAMATWRSTRSAAPGRMRASGASMAGRARS